MVKLNIGDTIKYLFENEIEINIYNNHDSHSFIEGLNYFDENDYKDLFLDKIIEKIKISNID
jgi:hypothetical protein